MSVIDLDKEDLSELRLEDLSANAQRRLFHKQHGGTRIEIKGDYLYPDGARMEVHPLGLMTPPDANLYERYRWIILYHEAKVKRSEDAFHELKHRLTCQVEMAMQSAAQNNPIQPPTEEQIDELQELQNIVVKCRKDLEKAQAEREKHKPEYLHLREQRATGIRSAAASAKLAIDQFKV